MNKDYKLGNPYKCCCRCKNSKRLKGYNIIAECGLTGMMVNLYAKEICKYFENKKKQSGEQK